MTARRSTLRPTSDDERVVTRSASAASLIFNGGKICGKLASRADIARERDGRT
jgi:hypothetical protein